MPRRRIDMEGICMNRLNLPAGDSGAESDEESRPDWDPYSVWLTHIMRSPQTQGDAPAAPDQKDEGWNPYNVWQSMIKG